MFFANITKNNLINLAKYDSKSDVRSEALSKLAGLKDKKLTQLFVNAVATDSSYNVIREALYALEDIDSAAALTAAVKLENENETPILIAVSHVFSLFGGAAENNYFTSKLNDKSIESFATLTYNYGAYLARINDDAIRESGINFLLDRAKNLPLSWDRYTAMKATESALDGFKTERENTSDQKRKDELDAKIKLLENKIQHVKDNEPDGTIKDYYYLHNDEK